MTFPAVTAVMVIGNVAEFETRDAEALNSRIPE